MKNCTKNKISKVWLIALLTFIAYTILPLWGSGGLLAQTSVTLDPACQSCPPSATLNSNAATPNPTPVPSCGTVAGTYKVGTALTASNTITLSLNVITAGAYSITTTATNGMTFTGTGTFAGTGVQSVTLVGTGTPLTAGTTAILVQYGGTTCSVAITVASNAPTNPAPVLGGPIAPVFSGRTCFDVAISNDGTNNCALLTARAPQKADFNLMAINQQVYTFTPNGTVSNVRFVYVNTNGNVITALTGGNTGNNISTPVTATASFNTGLNALATGLTNANALSADIYVIFNDGATNNGTDRQLKITPNVKDCACCGAWSWTNANPNQPKVWLQFMCHNLGADESKNPFVYLQETIGDLYQWGRPTDGHEKRTSGYLADQPSPTFIPNHPKFLFGNVLNAGWTVSTDYKRWGSGIILQDADPGHTSNGTFNEPKGPTDPCPSGWKVPSMGQWTSLYVGIIGGYAINETIPPTGSYPTANAITNDITTFGAGYSIGNLLYLPLAGQRFGINLQATGLEGHYMSSSLWNAGAAVPFGGIASGWLQLTATLSQTSPWYRPQDNSGRAVNGDFAGSVRCVQDW